MREIAFCTAADPAVNLLKWGIEELRRHGYEMSAGTVYPMLHGLEKKGYLTSRHERTGRRERRVYDITEQGRTALADAKTKVKELFGELVEGG
ncbi:PadR family transcriptional regulator [Escherichia coli]|uniref:PadR family transcriptional regulator n=1 Tax=Escherichia coli TaxID=562 RepID=UPI00292D3E26|nr:helix-turn-helix transcriptional regulator [Escherichia coli]